MKENLKQLGWILFYAVKAILYFSAIRVILFLVGEPTDAEVFIAFLLAILVAWLLWLEAKSIYQKLKQKFGK